MKKLMNKKAKSKQLSKKKISKKPIKKAKLHNVEKNRVVVEKKPVAKKQKKIVKKSVKKVFKKAKPIKKVDKKIITKKINKVVEPKKQKKIVKKSVKKVFKKAKPIKKVDKKIITKKINKVVEPKKKAKIKVIDQSSPKITNEQIDIIFKKLFSSNKIKTKDTGETSIRTSTFVKEFANKELTKEQIDYIGDTLTSNNVTMIGKADKVISPLSEHLNSLVKTSKTSSSDNVNSLLKKMFGGTIAASKPLSTEEEKKYIKMLGSKSEIIKKIGRSKLIESNLRLVVSIARRHINKGIDLEDLIQEGYIGLMIGIDKFDWTSSWKLSTYATWWIRQAITKTIGNYGRLISMPANMSEQLNQIRLMEEHLTNENGKTPSIREISEALGGDKKGYGENKIIDFKRIAQAPISLEKELRSDDETHISDFVKDDVSSTNISVFNEKKDKIKKLMREKLKQDELAVMQLRWGINVNGNALEDPLSLDETARRMGKTKDQIRLIENRAWKSLKAGQDFNKLKSLLGAGENDSE